MKIEKRDVIDYINSFGDIRTASPEDQRKAIEIFVHKIIVTDDNIDIYIMSPPREEQDISHSVQDGSPLPTPYEILMTVRRKYTRQ